MSMLIRGAIVLLMSAALCGCRNGYSIFGGPSLSKSKGGYAQVERVMLPPHEKIEARHDHIIHVKKDKSNFYVLLGPYKGTSSVGHFVNPTAGWQVDGGYSYITGWLPMVMARRVVAAATGTTMVVQLDGDIDRVYLLNPARNDAVVVSMISNPSRYETLKGSEVYVESGPQTPNDITSPAPIPTDPANPLRQFIEYVKARALAGGLP